MRILWPQSAKARRWQSPVGVSETDAEGSRENKEAQKYIKMSSSEFFVLLRAFVGGATSCL